MCDKVKVAALNDSWYIGLCIYNVVILATLGVAVNFVVEASMDLVYVSTSCLIILGSTLTQSLIFVPKVTHTSHSIHTQPPLCA